MRWAPGALCAALLICLLLPAMAEARWGRPFRLTQPFSLDVVAPQVALSADGTAAVTFSVQDGDTPSNSTAYAVWRNPRGRSSRPRPVASGQLVLASAFDGRSLELLTGESPAPLACCSSASVLNTSSGRSFGAPHTIVSDLDGATIGRLLSFSGRLLAAVATERGVWVAQSAVDRRFGSTHLLTSADARPEAMQAATRSHGGTMVAWIERNNRSAIPHQVFVATGTARSAPGKAHAALTVPRRHRIDELALADGGSTVAWIESWYGRHGSYHSQVDAADLAHPRRVSAFPLSGTVAAGLSFATDRAGDQLLAWRSCALAGSCSVREALRRAGHQFTTPSRLGGSDAAEVPEAALAPNGSGLVGWIEDGHVKAAALARSASRFSAAHTVSATSYAADLALAFGPSATAFATWSQGTLAPVVMGATFTGG